MKKITPIHHGEILLEEFLKPLGINQARLAKDLKVPATRISSIIHGKRAITADTALRMSHYFGMSKDFWIGLQKRYELDVAEDFFGKAINSEISPIKTDIA